MKIRWFEKRKQPRLKQNISAFCEDKNSSEKSIIITDISIGGIRFNAKDLSNVPDYPKVTVNLYGKKINFSIEILQENKDDYRAQIKDIKEADRDCIMRYIRDNKG